MKKSEFIHFEKLKKNFVFILKSVHEEPSTLPPHFHNAHHLLYIIKGRGMLNLMRKKLPIKRNDLILVKKGEMHEIVDDRNDLISLYGIYFREREIARENESLHQYISSLGLNSRIYPVNSSPFLIKIPLLIREVLFEENNWSGDSNLIQKIKIIEILISLKRYLFCSAGDAHMNKSRLSQTERNIIGIIEYLESNFYKDFSLNEIAAVSHVGKRQFDRVFNKLTGMSFIEYLNKTRIEQAKKLLMSNNKEIITTCFDVGFNDLSYFYRVFKRHTGCTPKEYKKINGG